MLDARNISVHFGGVRAVDDVSLAAPANEILGIIGPNGSGKTTFLNALSGVVPARGSLFVGTQPIPLGRPSATRAAGVMRVFQHPQIFGSLTCLENVCLSSPQRRFTGVIGAWCARPAMLRLERQRWQRALAALDFVGIAHLANASGDDLTYGQQRLLEIARAIAGEPRVLLLDEPSAGLNDEETKQLQQLVQSLRASGLALVVVDHKIDFIDALCDRVAVLELGQLIAYGGTAEVWSDAKVVDAYLGVAHGA
jgi:ABC-type branched-subunit amino acid transport system ATPase component